jgi:hypothetical protein
MRRLKKLKGLKSHLTRPPLWGLLYDHTNFVRDCLTATFASETAPPSLLGGLMYL